MIDISISRRTDEAPIVSLADELHGAILDAMTYDPVPVVMLPTLDETARIAAMAAAADVFGIDPTDPAIDKLIDFAATATLYGFVVGRIHANTVDKE